MPVPARKQDCPQKIRLLREYHFTVADYSRAVTVLAERAGVISKAEYTRIREFTEEARTKSEAVRAAIDRHVAEHGC